MRYVIVAEYDALRQVCTNDECPAKWKGGIYDEPFKLCPICFHALITEDVYVK